MKKLKIIVFLIVIVEALFLLNTICYAGYSFSEVTYNIDSVGKEFEFNPILLKNQVLGFNFIYVPYILILLYIVIQIILMKKYKKDKLSNNLKLCLKINIIVILLICIVNSFISNYIIDKSKEVIYITSTMYIQNSFLWAKIVNIAVNTLILIFGIVFSKKMLKNTIEEKIKLQNKKMLIITIVLIIILLGMCFITKRGPSMHVVERDWSFGTTTNIRQYDLKVFKDKNIGDTIFLVKEIDDEGVLIEYERGYYEKPSNSNDNSSSILFNNYEYKTEITQQKMKWNVNYSYSQSTDPMLCIDGGTDYYVRFEK